MYNVIVYMGYFKWQYIDTFLLAVYLKDVPAENGYENWIKIT